MPTPTPHWWQSAVLYQIYPLSFVDSNGDGLGDLPGIIQKLPYLRDLGVTGVWLCPFYDSPLEYDYGYGPSNLTAINPLFGTMADFDRLLDTARRLGIRIIMEWAVTNASVFGPWFTESKSSRTNPKADWFLWSDTVPNNWVSFSGGSLWHYCPERNQYYMGMFFKQHAEFNWRSPTLRQAVYDAMEFWLRKGIDGFRLDTVSMYVKDQLLRDNPPVQADATWYLDPADPIHKSKYLQYLIPDWAKFDHLHDINQPESLDILREMRALCDKHHPDFLLLGESDIADPISQQLCANGMSVANNFKLLRTRWSPAAFHRTLRDETGLLTSLQCVNTFSNHDNGRAISRYATANPAETLARARILATLTLTLPGVPMLYYGEEIAMPDGDLAFRELTDPMSLRWHYLNNDTGLIRDVARTPMQWTAGPQAGFSTTKPWLRPHSGYAQTNVQLQQDDTASMLTFYRRLIALRKSTPALQTGAFALLSADTDPFLFYSCTQDSQTVCTLINLTHDPVAVPLARFNLNPATLRPLFSLHPTPSVTHSLPLAAYDILLLH